MKKQIRAVLLFTFLFTGASAFGNDFSLSAGAGGLIGEVFTRYSIDAKGSMPMKARQEMDQFNLGFLAFIDATYGELSVTFQKGANTYTQTVNIALDDFPTQVCDGWETMLGFTLLLKYPFLLSERFTLFPLLGAEYQICLIQRRAQDDGWIYDRDDGREKDKDGNAFSLSDWNALWIHIGGGADFALSENVFIRGELLYSIRTMTSWESKNLAQVKSTTGDQDPSMGGLTSGPSFRLSMGYRFF